MLPTQGIHHIVQTLFNFKNNKRIVILCPSAIKRILIYEFTEIFHLLVSFSSVVDVFYLSLVVLKRITFSTSGGDICKGYYSSQSSCMCNTQASIICNMGNLIILSEIFLYYFD